MADLELKDLIESEVQNELENLKKIELGTDEHKAATDDICKLYSKVLECKKADCEFDRAMNQEDLEEKKYRSDVIRQENELEEKQKDRKIRLVVDTAKIVLPLTVYAVLIYKGFKFEETGTISSTCLRNLIGKIKPS